MFSIISSRHVYKHHWYRGPTVSELLTLISFIGIFLILIAVGSKISYNNWILSCICNSSEDSQDTAWYDRICQTLNCWDKYGHTIPFKLDKALNLDSYFVFDQNRSCHYSSLRTSVHYQFKSKLVNYDAILKRPINLCDVFCLFWTLQIQVPSH